MVRSVVKGTPFGPAHLSVVSYNLLAPLYVRPLDKRTGGVQAFAAFQWAEPAEEVLEWSVRRPRLLTELQACRADVICLQEVQFDAGDAGGFSLPSWLRLVTGLSMAPLMPQGILKICMRVQVKSLAGSLNRGSDMVLTSTDDLIQGLILELSLIHI